MKTKLVFIFMAIVSVSARAQQTTALPNYLFAGQVSTLVKKLGLPVDSATIYLASSGQFKKTQETATDVLYRSEEYNTVIDFKKNAGGQIVLIIFDMPVSMLSTAQKAITMMGMIASGTAAPPGFTAYANIKRAAFLNPDAGQGSLKLVLVSGE